MGDPTSSVSITEEVTTEEFRIGLELVDETDRSGTKVARLHLVTEDGRHAHRGNVLVIKDGEDGLYIDRISNVNAEYVDVDGPGGRIRANR